MYLLVGLCMCVREKDLSLACSGIQTYPGMSDEPKNRSRRRWFIWRFNMERKARSLWRESWCLLETCPLAPLPGTQSWGLWGEGLEEATISTGAWNTQTLLGSCYAVRNSSGVGLVWQLQQKKERTWGTISSILTEDPAKRVRIRHPLQQLLR